MYILTQEEMNNLKTTKKYTYDLTVKQLQELCTKIANEMPVVWGWGVSGRP